MSLKNFSNSRHLQQLAKTSDLIVLPLLHPTTSEVNLKLTILFYKADKVKFKNLDFSSTGIRGVT